MEEGKLEARSLELELRSFVFEVSCQSIQPAVVVRFMLS